VLAKLCLVVGQEGDKCLIEHEGLCSTSIPRFEELLVETAMHLGCTSNEVKAALIPFLLTDIT
jgi:hypothetical protein